MLPVCSLRRGRGRRIAILAFALGVSCYVWLHIAREAALARAQAEVAPADNKVVVLEREIDSPPCSDGQATLDDLALKKRIEAELAADVPAYRLTLRDHRTVKGRIVAETPTQIKFREGSGYSDYIVSVYPRSEIAAITGLPTPSMEVTRQDVLLVKEFPGYHFVKNGPYSVVTDAPYAEVDQTLRVLTQLRQQFQQRFAPLIRDRDSGKIVQIVLFDSEAPFRACARRLAPALVESAGFYSSADNRLVLLNQMATTQFAKVQERIDQRLRALDASDNQSENRIQASAHLEALSSQITTEAKSMTDRLTRHEGAHQLFRAFGIQCKFAIEPTWLTEGLAEYCETPEIGAYHSVLAERLAAVRDAGALLPLNVLLNHRDHSGFFSLGTANVEKAYEESWALTYFLMQRQYHDRFFEFVKYYRDINDVNTAAAAQEADGEVLLAAFLQTDVSVLEAQWQKFVNHM